MNNTETIIKFTNDKKFANFLCNLFERWCDERKYEDFSEYEKVIKKNLPSNIKFLKGSKKPFGFQANVGKLKILFFLKLRGNLASFCAKSIIND
jgi:hypothetical protein